MDEWRNMARAWKRYRISRLIDFCKRILLYNTEKKTVVPNTTIQIAHLRKMAIMMVLIEFFARAYWIKTTQKECIKRGDGNERTRGFHVMSVTKVLYSLHVTRIFSVTEMQVFFRCSVLWTTWRCSDVGVLNMNRKYWTEGARTLEVRFSSLPCIDWWILERL